MRNAEGEFLVGFYGSAGISHIGHAEVLALLHGLRLCKERRYGAVQCYSDSRNTIRMVQEGVPIQHQEANEVAAIKHLLGQDWQVQLTHTYREENQCADYLAKMGATLDKTLTVLQHPPVGMESLLLADALGVSFPRG